MSEKRKPADNSISKVLTNSALSLLSIIILTIAFSLILSWVLLTTGTPEKYYRVANILILLIPSFITGRIIVRRRLGNIFLTSFLSSLFYFILLVLLSLLFNPDEFNLITLISNFIIPFLSMLLSALTTREKKKRKKKK